MALNEIFKVGKSISLPVPADVKSGQAIRIGVLNGVAIVDEGTGGNKDGWTSVDMFGGHKFKLAGAKVGDPVYIKDGALTLTASGGNLWGAVTHLDRDDFVVILTQAISV